MQEVIDRSEQWF